MSRIRFDHARKRWFPLASAFLLALTQTGCGPQATPTALPPTGARPPAATDTRPPAVTPTRAATATVDCRVGPSRVDEITYPSSVLDKPIAVRVYVPPCHDQTVQPLPTLYLLHGYPYDETQWDLLGLLSLVDEKVRDGTWPSFLMVMPRIPDPLFRSTDGGPYSYEAELTEGLVSFVDLNYHSDPRPDRRAIAGISRGGVWSLEIALRNPDVFDGVAAISPALQLNHARQEYDPFFLVRRGEGLPTKIYLLAGDEDWARQATEDLALLLKGLGVAHEMRVYPGGHDDASWAPELEPLIDFLVADWPRP